MAFHALQQFELCPGAYKVMLRVLYFVVCVTVEVVGKETDALHVREKCGCIWEILNLDRQQE